MELFFKYTTGCRSSSTSPFRLSGGADLLFTSSVDTAADFTLVRLKNTPSWVGAYSIPWISTAQRGRKFQTVVDDDGVARANLCGVHNRRDYYVYYTSASVIVSPVLTASCSHLRATVPTSTEFTIQTV